MKIIAAIDLMNGKVVRLLQGDPDKKKVYSADPLKIAKKWENCGADMIQFVDLDATLGYGSNISIIEKIVRNISIPTIVAGGLRNEKIINDTLKFASRVVLGTAAFTNKKLLQKLLVYNDRIIIAIDHVCGNVAIDGWKKKTEIRLVDSIDNFIKTGFSYFLLTDIEKDGTLQGPNLDVYKSVCKMQKANIFAAGGISNLKEIANLKKTNVYGIVLGKSLYEDLLIISEVKKI